MSATAGIVVHYFMCTRFWNGKNSTFGDSQDIYDNSSINKSHDDEYGRWENFFDGAHSYEPTMPSIKRNGYERKILGPLHNQDCFHHPVMNVPLHGDGVDREYIPLSKRQPSNIYRLNIMSIKPVDIDIRSEAIQVATPPSGTLDGIKAFLFDVTSYTRVSFLMSSQHMLGLLLSLWALLNIMFRCVRYLCVRYCTLPEQSSVIQGSFSPLFSDPALFPVPIINSPDTSQPPTPEMTPEILSSPSLSQSDLEDEIAVEISLFGYASNYNPYPVYYTSQSSNGNNAIESGFSTNRLDADHSYLLPAIPPNDPSNPNPVDAQGNLPLLPFDPNKDGRCLTRPKSRWTWIPARTKVRPWSRSVVQVHTPASASASASTSALALTSASAPMPSEPPSGSSVQLVSPLPKPSRAEEIKQERPPVLRFPFINIEHLGSTSTPNGRSSDFSRSANPWWRVGHDTSNDNDEFVMGSFGGQLGLTLNAESESEY